MSRRKTLAALDGTFGYLQDNEQIAVNGFKEAGILMFLVVRLNLDFHMYAKLQNFTIAPIKLYTAPKSVSIFVVLLFDSHVFSLLSWLLVLCLTF